MSIKKHEWHFANMVQVSITKHKMAFWNFETLIILESIFCEPRGHQNNIAIFLDPKQSSSHRTLTITKNEFYNGGILEISEI